MKKLLLRITHNKYIQAAVLIVLTQIIVFYPVFIKGNVISSDINLVFPPFIQFRPEGYTLDTDLRSDMTDSYYPVTQNFYDDIKRDNSTRWDNNQKLGIPTDVILKNHSPFSLLNLVFESDIALTVEILVKFFLGGFFMYILLREFKINHIASIFGAISFMYSGFNIVWFWNFAATASLCLPIILASSLKVLKGNYKFIPSLILGVSYALLAGFVSGAGYILYFTAAFLLYRFVSDLPRILQGYSRNKRFIISIRKILEDSKNYFIIAGVVLFGISLSAFTLFPTVHWLNRINVGYREMNSKSFLPFIKNGPQLLMPYYNGGPLTRALAGIQFFGPSNYNETSGYIGMIGTIMLLIGVLFAIIKKNKDMIFMFVSYVFFITVIYGIGPSLNLLRNLPVFSSSASTRTLMLITFSGSVLAAYGFSKLGVLLGFIRKWSIRKRLLYIVVPIVIPLAFIILFIIRTFKLENFSGGFEIRAIVNFVRGSNYRKPLYHAFNIIALNICILFTALLLIIISAKKRFTRALYVLLLVLSFLELSIYSLKQISDLPRDLHYPVTESISYLQENTGELERVLTLNYAIGPAGTGVYYDLHNMMDHDLYTEQERDYFSRIHIDESRIWATRTFPLLKYDNINYASKELDELNVKYVVFPPDIEKPELDQLPGLSENFKEVYYDKDELRIYENKGDFSLVHWIGDDSPNIEILDLRDGYEKFSVKNVSSEGTLYTSEIYYDKWKVFVDGEERELKSVREGLFKGVKIEKGDSIVEFKYEAGGIYWGGFIYTSIIFSSALLCNLWFTIKYIKKLLRLNQQ